VSLAALMRVNGLGAKDMIRVGQLINLPVDAQAARPRRPLLASDEPEARPPVSSVVPAGAPGTYTVRAATASPRSRSGSASTPTTCSRRTRSRTAI
jgi:hypothetical protein